MIRCPYCGNKIEKKVEYANLSFKRKAILEYILGGGPVGVKVEDVRNRFFPVDCSDVTLRTTMHYINKEIAPTHILRQGGILKIKEVGNIEKA